MYTNAGRFYEFHLINSWWRDMTNTLIRPPFSIHPLGRQHAMAELPKGPAPKIFTDCDDRWYFIKRWKNLNLRACYKSFLSEILQYIQQRIRHEVLASNCFEWVQWRVDITALINDNYCFNGWYIYGWVVRSFSHDLTGWINKNNITDSINKIIGFRAACGRVQ